MVGRSLLYLGFAAFSILGQNQTTTVDGHVMNSLTGEAIGGAIVRLIPLRSMAINRERRNQQTTSLADGTFHLDGVNPGTYFIRAEHSGFSLSRGARSKFVDLSS